MVASGLETICLESLYLKGGLKVSYTLPELPYAYDALEPYIDARTMEIHHSKHHNAYVQKVNAAIEGTELENLSIEQLVSNLDGVPENIRGAVRNNGGGHANHSLFWTVMSPNERRSLRQQFGCEVISQRRVSFERIGGGPQIRGKSPLQIKRDGIWQHPVRNRRIARLARALDHEALILVENDEHRRQLTPLLCDDVIVTFQEAPPLEMATVIRCDAGVGGLPNSVIGNSIRIFDFNDRHHPVLRRRSRGRRAIYQQKGWI